MAISSPPPAKAFRVLEQVILQTMYGHKFGSCAVYREAHCKRVVAYSHGAEPVERLQCSWAMKTIARIYAAGLEEAQQNRNSACVLNLAQCIGCTIAHFIIAVLQRHRQGVQGRDTDFTDHYPNAVPVRHRSNQQRINVSFAQLDYFRPLSGTYECNCRLFRRGRLIVQLVQGFGRSLPCF